MTQGLIRPLCGLIPSGRRHCVTTSAPMLSASAVEPEGSHQACTPRVIQKAPDGAFCITGGEAVRLIVVRQNPAEFINKHI